MHRAVVAALALVMLLGPSGAAAAQGAYGCGPPVFPCEPGRLPAACEPVGCLPMAPPAAAPSGQSVPPRDSEPQSPPPSAIEALPPAQPADETGARADAPPRQGPAPRNGGEPRLPAPSISEEPPLPTEAALPPQAEAAAAAASQGAAGASASGRYGEAQPAPAAQEPAVSAAPAEPSPVSPVVPADDADIFDTPPAQAPAAPAPGAPVEPPPAEAPADSTPASPGAEDLFSAGPERHQEEPGGFRGARWRTWSDASGRFACEAWLAAATAEGVTLKRLGGEQVAVAYRDLSDHDLEFVRRQVEALRLERTAAAARMASGAR
ncbi:MAG TPA: SHD1 domain-containing protein [Lacipirellulaceae bacterium]|nr:SHD1 domain-containing protein [Lacipirellulaceae bacterium]